MAREDGAEHEYLRERVNVEALKYLACREGAHLWRPGGGPPLRTIIGDFLAQVKDGFMRSAWREERGAWRVQSAMLEE